MEEEQPLIVNSDTGESHYGSNSTTKDKAGTSCTSRIPCRYILVLMIFGANMTHFTQRVGFNIALVAMVNYTADTNYGNNNTSHDCPLPANMSQAKNSQQTKEGGFDWDAKLQGVLLGAFYYGYPLSQVPGGYLADRYGGKYVFIFMGLGTGVLNLLTPVVANWSSYGIIVIRVLQGVCQGPLAPSMVSMMSRWIPPTERTTMFTIAATGYSLGTIVSSGLSGLLCESTFLGGWPSVFYIFGCVGIVWTLCWMPLIYSTPAEHPRISVQELAYIEKGTQCLGQIKYRQPPWCSISKSGPVWAVIVFMIMDAFSFYIVFSCLPIYMKQVLHFNIAEDGILFSLPYIARIPVTPLIGWLVDLFSRKGYIRVVNIRRLTSVIGELVPAGLLLVIGYVGCNADMVVTLLILNNVFNTFVVAGPSQSLFDIAPLYAGTIMGIINGVSNTPGFIAPQVVAAVTGNSGDRKQWQTVFYIGAAVSALGTLVYCVLISDKVQPWAKPDIQEDVKHEEEPKL